MKKLFFLFLLMILIGISAKAQVVLTTSVTGENVTLTAEDLFALSAIVESTISVDEKVCLIGNYVYEKQQVAISTETSIQIIEYIPEKICFEIGPNGDTIKVPCNQQ